MVAKSAAKASGYQLTVRSLSRARSQGWLTLGGDRSGRALIACALGRSGVSALKREGDGATPLGGWRLVEVLYRADRRMRPSTGLPVRIIRPTDGWCDASGDRNYNRPVRLPYPASSETMWREDRLYDLVVVLDHNSRPRMRGAGSAIFMHVARPGHTPTEGCVAMSERDLERLLKRLRRGATIRV